MKMGGYSFGSGDPQDGAVFLPCIFDEVFEAHINGDVLWRFVELDDTLVKKLDKGLVEDADYLFGQREWRKFDEFFA